LNGIIVIQVGLLLLLLPACYKLQPLTIEAVAGQGLHSIMVSIVATCTILVQSKYFMLERFTITFLNT